MLRGGDGKKKNVGAAESKIERSVGDAVYSEDMRQGVKENEKKR